MDFSEPISRVNVALMRLPSVVVVVIHCLLHAHLEKSRDAECRPAPQQRPPDANSSRRRQMHGLA